MSKTSRTELAARGQTIVRYLLRNGLSITRNFYDRLKSCEAADIAAIGEGTYQMSILTPYEVFLLLQSIRRGEKRVKKEYRVGKYKFQCYDHNGELVKTKRDGFTKAVIPELDIGVRRSYDADDRHKWVKKPSDDTLMLLYMSLSKEHHRMVSKISLT